MKVQWSCFWHRAQLVSSAVFEWVSLCWRSSSKKVSWRAWSLDRPRRMKTGLSPVVVEPEVMLAMSSSLRCGMEPAGSMATVRLV
jgi:hypothetical protein